MVRSNEQDKMAEVILHGNRVLDRIQGRWPPAVRVRRAKQATVVYSTYPYLFAELLDSVAERDMRRLALGLRLVADAVSVADRLCDRAAGAEIADDAMAVSALQFEAQRILSRLFPPASTFWSRYRQFSGEWAWACITEKRLVEMRMPWQGLEDPTVRRIAGGKAALAKLVATAVVELARRPDLADRLERSIAACHLGIQLMDDLQDWKDDLRSGTPTTLVLALVRARPDLASDPPGEAVLDEFARELHSSGHAAWAASQALECFRAAAAEVDGLELRRWGERIERAESRCERLLADLQALTSAAVVRDRDRESEAELLAGLAAGGDLPLALVSALLNECRTGFRRVRHVLPYPPAFDPYGARPPVIGDVWPRAFVANALAAARAVAPGPIDAALEHERTHLLERLRADGTVGWSYFEGVSEVELSVDSSALALRVLGASPGSDAGIREVATRCLDRIFAGQSEDGFVTSFLIAPGLEHGVPEARALNVPGDWLRFRDVESVALAAEVADRIDAPRYLDRTTRALAALLKAQRADGSWCSFNLYRRRAFGTLAVVELLARRATGHEALERVLGLVRRTQRPDGGWHLEHGRETDVFDTAHMLLTVRTLRAAGHGTAADDGLVARGRAALLTAVRRLVRAPAVELLSIGRAVYGSRLVPAAAALRALSTSD